MEIGNKIQELRTERHLSQEAVAETLGISRQAVAKWENGQSVPSTSNLLALCQMFDVPLEALTGYTPKAPADPPPSDDCNDRKKRVLPVLIVLCMVFGGISLIAWGMQQSNSLPDNVIGYADSETGIFVSGSSLLLDLLYGITIVLILFTLIFWIRSKKGQRKGRKG